jgi:hypothetical protein
MVVVEALYTMDAHMHGHGVYMAVKLDISKVYDIVEWNFLKEVMRKIGFATYGIFFTLTCVLTLTYSVLVNGQPYGKITPTRGLRPAYPLSPYFFILCNSSSPSSKLPFAANTKITTHSYIVLS